MLSELELDKGGGTTTTLLICAASLSTKFTSNSSLVTTARLVSVPVRFAVPRTVIVTLAPLARFPGSHTTIPPACAQPPSLALAETKLIPSARTWVNRTDVAEFELRLVIVQA